MRQLSTECVASSRPMGLWVALSTLVSIPCYPCYPCYPRYLSLSLSYPYPYPYPYRYRIRIPIPIRIRIPIPILAIPAHTRLLSLLSLSPGHADRHPSSQATVPMYLKSILAALVELHARRLVHMDIKPANILCASYQLH